MSRSISRLSLVVLLAVATVVGCSRQPSDITGKPDVVSLLAQWTDARVSETSTAPQPTRPTELRFSDQSEVRWQAVHGVSSLRVEDGRLRGRITEPNAVIALSFDSPVGAGDDLWAVEIRQQTSEGRQIAVMPMLPDNGPPPPAFTQGALALWPLASPLLASEYSETYRINVNEVPVLGMPLALTDFHSVLVRPSDAVGAEFSLESIRFIFRKEHLAGIDSGPGWHGLGDVYRETLVSRSPETIVFDLQLPDAAWLDLAIGTVEAAPPTFRVSVATDGDAAQLVAELQPSAPESWQQERVDLSPWSGQTVRLELQAQADEPSLAFWGAPTVRASVTPDGSGSPQAVVLYLTDTLRRDHLQDWGYQRDTAPTLSRLAAEGVRFEDAVAQSTWTKASVPSILTALYPSTTGVNDLPDRVSAGETTLAEIFREAGYATFATSSVPFTGQLTNLHQGVEVLYEFGAAEEAIGEHHSKTSTIWVDHYLEWLEAHADVPTFALIHVMDPHSPFQPPSPYDEMFSEEESRQKFAEQAQKVEPLIVDPMLRRFLMPSRQELEQAGVDEESFLAQEKAWYDASIRHLDDNLGRVVDSLANLGLGNDALLAVVSDHGEEFLEHGNHWHGNTVYGEVANVPMLLWGQGVPKGKVIEPTVQTIDLLPTLAELSGLEIPERAQGRSLVPLLRGESARNLPAFTERRVRSVDVPGSYSMFAIVKDGWKLIWNEGAPDGVPTHELYDHEADPLNLDDVAADHADVVASLSSELERWKEWAEAQQLDEEDLESSMSAEELEQLRSLGYID